MKRVLILNGDTYVGQHIARVFHQSHEYEIDVTLSRHDDDTVARQRQLQPDSAVREKKPCLTVKDVAAAASTNAAGSDLAPLVEYMPSALSPYANHVVPRHNDDPATFCKRVLENDVIVAVLEDDSYDAECAIKVLAGSHYEVEKTFVLVSSALTWANTRMVDVARVRAERVKAREEAIAAFREETEGEVDEEGQPIPLPPHLANPLDEETELDIAETQVPPRTYAEEEYANRIPHPRYQHWRLLEHLVKHANSQTLHTYVLFAGLPYGHGEGPLQSLARAAWHHQTLTQYGPGDNVIPMIHVEDLARIAYKLGSAYDVYDERYLVAVDRGQLTQHELLHILAKSLGGAVKEAPLCATAQTNGTSPPPLDLVHIETATAPRPPTVETLRAQFGNLPSDGLRMPFFLSDIRLEPASVLSYHTEDEWIALEGFAQNVHKVVDQFRQTHGATPTRLVLAGPPLCGREGVAESLAAHFAAPLITAKSAVAAYEVRATEVRTQLADLLATRLQRRRDRAHARLVTQALAEKARLREEAREARRLKRAQAGGADKDDGDDDENDEEDETEEEDEAQQESGDSDEEGEEGAAAAAKDLPMVFPQDRHSDVRAIVRHPKRLLGLLGDGASNDIDESVLDYFLDDHNCALFRSEDGEDVDTVRGDMADELDDEENEEEDADNEVLDDIEVTPEDERDPDVPPEEQGPTRAQVRARLAIRRQDAVERALIKSLRLEYSLMLKVLSMRVVDGKLPHPQPIRDDTGDDDADDVSSQRRGTEDGSEGEEDEPFDEEANDDGEGPESEEGHSHTDASSSSEEEEEEKSGHDGGGGDAHCLPTGGRYLDAAVACMVRWRLRQADCRNRGYVLLDFPRAVRQAYLLFFTPQVADGEEDEQDAAAERVAKRARPLTTVEDAIAPEDSDYPFLENFVAMDAEARRARETELTQYLLVDGQESLEAADMHRLQGRQLLDVLQKAGFGTVEEGLLAPVSEELFPHELILMREDADVLQLRANAVRSAIKEAFALPLHDGLDNTTGTHTAAPTAAAAGSGTRVVKQLRQQQKERQPLAQPSGDAGEWSFSVRMSAGHKRTESHMPETSHTAETAKHRAVRLFRKLTAPFPRSLRDFQSQFSASGTPAESVLTWLQSVSTTARLGATPAPVMVVADAIDGGDDGAEDGEVAAAQRLEAPSTSRTLRVIQVQAPARSTAEVCREMFTYCHFTEEVAPQQARVLSSTLHGGNQLIGNAAAWLAALGAARKSSVAAPPASGQPHEGGVGHPHTGVPEIAQPYDHREAIERVQRLLAQLPSGADDRAFLAELVNEEHRRARAAVMAASAPQPRKAQQTVVVTAPTSAGTATRDDATATDSVPFPPLALFTAQLCASLLRDVRVIHFGPPLRHPADAAGQLHTTKNGPRAARVSSEQTLVSTVRGTAAQSHSALGVSSEERQEAEWLANLHAKEQEEADNARQSILDAVRSERQALRSLQMRDACRESEAAQAMPMETYLMTYVLPSLTPALTEVTKLRAEKPVTALADLLFNYKRRTAI